MKDIIRKWEKIKIDMMKKSYNGNTEEVEYRKKEEKDEMRKMEFFTIITISDAQIWNREVSLGNFKNHNCPDKFLKTKTLFSFDRFVCMITPVNESMVQQEYGVVG